MESEKGLLNRIEDLLFVQAIRQGLVLTIPLLMIGSFALIANILPVPSYQAFLESDGLWLSEFFAGINQAAFGILGLCITVSVSACYARLRSNDIFLAVGSVFASLSAYVLFIGVFSEDFSTASLGAEGMFTALVSACAGSAIYCWINEKEFFNQKKLYTVGADTNFNVALSIIIPIGIVAILAYLFNTAIANIFEVNGFEELFDLAVHNLFNAFEDNSTKTLLFVILADFLWFFGIHGTNVLEGVAQNLFYVDGVISTAGFGFLNKPVIDTFVFMGGCGTTVSLLVAILLFSKKKNNRNLGKMAFLPMLFNVNELMLFGLPIVFNPLFFIPFLLVPLVCIAITGLAMTSGIVPASTTSVSWAMPLFVNGYQATGSFAGVVLQIVNITVGAFIYRWFLVRYEKRSNERLRRHLSSLVNILKKSEENGDVLILTELNGHEGLLAKTLASDLAHVVKTPNTFKMYYQPQYDENGLCVGSEALMRWDHPICGMIYPPLVMGLAQETGLLQELERKFFRLTCKDIKGLIDKGLCPGKTSINITAATLQEASFVDFLAELINDYPELKGYLCIELTEQTSLLMNEKVEDRMEAIRQMGFSFAIDDFSMGRTSVKYLQSNLFDLVKLDGSLIAAMLENERSEEIISSLVQMGNTMNFRVIAEFVETKEQRDRLKNLGCHLYQGWFFSPAVPLGEFETLLLREKGHNIKST